MHVVLDTECYENYFLATFSFENGEIIEYEKYNDQPNMDIMPILTRVLKFNTLVTFNGRNYDVPILTLAAHGYANAVLKEASDLIIRGNYMPWHIERKYDVSMLQFDHIDIINLLPLFESLKLYGARNNTKRLQDLPYDPASRIDDAKAAHLRDYCRDDCIITWELFISQWPQIQLRIKLGETYNQDLRSKSDAQISEAVMKSEYENITKKVLIKPIDSGEMPKEISYEAPPWVSFTKASLTSFVYRLNRETFELSEKGSPIAPDWLKGRVQMINDRPYAVGLGGLHAQNKCESYYSDRNGQLIDIDVQSYYPRIILNERYEPPHMAGVFAQIYDSLVGQRLKAKAAGDTIAADTLKITINGTFGKLGSRFSALYAPQLLLAVTFTGQLALLMLIEMMAQRGVQCVSANTDGVTIKTPDGRYNTVVAEWQNITGFVMEETHYKSLHMRDVNNYFAITTDGKLKTKGIFKSPGVAKNPTASIVTNAAMAYVLYGENIADAIERCSDINQFLSVRTVRGGAAKDGEYLGKAVRWYYSTATKSAIHYITNGNKVAKTDRAMPMMNISGMIPDDLDLNWYIDEAKQTVDEIGYFGWL